ncbi:sulfotransferase domain-containing protein [Microbispora bryophytorum]|uniref:Sulfotransferase family protein n=1 Tax=Microbispora bryophytorum TaxID=1460882 RepID=A0A8H9LCB5_9ACTN|nr:sulfotransferase domain-containing protein [Microbispora bryophytorum]MBD3136563.1 sulfotransferase [Microbispora bryophytorum]TQS06162.1 sulfotransferase [Microbispora bryophytorum]GGO18254.1 sulfotransferase family protein [Microbispora bryophytorum]
MTAEPPVLVTGLPRSGTSWVGRMLTASGRLVYVNEPLNPQRPPGRSPGVLDASVTHRFQYICPGNETPWLAAFSRTVALRYNWLAEIRRNHGPGDLARMAKYGTAFTTGRLLARRALLDDPFALLSAEWFAGRLGCRVVVVVRDPVSFAGSWRRLGWRVDVRELLGQPLLLRDHPYVAELGALAGNRDVVTGAAMVWKVARRVTDTVARRAAGIKVVRYEDLCAAPLDGFRDLYDWCGLPWTGRAARRITAACTSSRSGSRPAFAWTGLSRTAYRPMDSRRALTVVSLPYEDAARVRALTTDSTAFGAPPRLAAVPPGS